MQVCRDYWARFEHFVKQLTNTCDEVGRPMVIMCTQQCALCDAWLSRKQRPLTRVV